MQLSKCWYVLRPLYGNWECNKNVFGALKTNYLLFRVISNPIKSCGNSIGLQKRNYVFWLK